LDAIQLNPYNWIHGEWKGINTKSQVGFDKNPQSHDPEPYQNNAMTIQTVGKVLITMRGRKIVKPETIQKSNGMLYFVCHLGIGYMLG
jgi:hypothetical protein